MIRLMAEGVRIRHKTVRVDSLVVIRDLSHRGAGGPNGFYPGCSRCDLDPPGHEGYKTKHVKVDSDGYAIVAVEYWQDLQRFIDDAGFEYANPVPEPPRQGLSLQVSPNGDAQGKLTVYHKHMQPILEKNIEKYKEM